MLDPSLDLTDDLKQLVDLAARHDGVDDLMRRGLEWLGRVAPYDLAAIMTLDDAGKLAVRAAHGSLANPAVRKHAIELNAFPTIREAIETRRARAMTDDDHGHGDGDPYDGVLDLPHGHSCMVVPLCAGDRCLGVMTLDRTVCEVYPQPVVNLAEVYGQVLAVAIDSQERRVQAEADAARHTLAGQAARSTRYGTGPGPVHSAAMQRVQHRAEQVAATRTPVLILGETGAGKERLAHSIHALSPRQCGPFVAVNCAALPQNLVESELFGHKKGAFTGATRDRPGRFALADGGTLFLDEVGELPADVQAKLLRVLQEGTFEPVGADRTVKTDVRIVAATHVDLMQAVEEGRFRADLYYRLDVFPLRLPALRDRLDDLPDLCRALLTTIGPRVGKTELHVTPAGLAHLRGHRWPGNIRELSNVLERAAILATGPALGPAVLELPGRAVAHTPATKGGPLVTLDEMQRQYIRRVLDHVGGKVYGEGGAAEVLGLKPSTLQSRMKKLGVVKNETIAH